MVNQKLKDVTVMLLVEKDISRIADKFARGHATAQEAFAMLVTANVKVLRPYAETLGTGKVRCVRNSPARLRELLRGSPLKTHDLATVYIQPSVQLAKATIEGDVSEAYQYVIDNLTLLMDANLGDRQDKAPVFTPNRLMAAGAGLTAKENSKFEVDAEHGLLLKGDRFGSLTIEQIKDALHDGESSKTALGMLTAMFGVDQEDTANGKEKLGTIGSFIKKIREVFAGSKEDKFALDACDTLEATMFDLRDELASEVALAAKVRESETEQNKAKRRIAAATARGFVREDAPIIEGRNREGNPLVAAVNAEENESDD